MKKEGFFVPYAQDVRKAWGDPYTLHTGCFFGEAVFGDVVFGNISGHPMPETFGIFQMRGKHKNRYLDKTDFYDYVTTPTNPRVACRTKFASAVAGWQALTTPQKAVYNKRAENLQMSGYNLFLKIFMLS